MNLWIIETGGTIASRKLSDTIDLAVEEADYSPFIKEHISVTVRRPYYILSENLTPDRWVSLAREVRRAAKEGAEGVLITHGSDTLPYTAAAMSFLLSDIEFPIVITAANRPPEEEGSNAAANLTASLEFLEHAPSGVSVVWQNPDGVVSVHPGYALAEAVGDRFFSLDALRARKTNETWEFFDMAAVNIRPIDAPKDFTEHIALVRALPGQDYREIRWNRPAAVLHTLYHSGTACAQGENTSFRVLKTRCLTENLPLYICPAKKSGESTYASAEVLRGDAVYPLAGISAEAAYVLLTLAYNQKEEEPEYVIRRFWEEFQRKIK